MHQLMAATLDTRHRRDPRDPARRARSDGSRERPRWPMIVLQTPKGWTGPKEVDGQAIEGLLALAPGAARRTRNETRRT